MLFQRWPSVKVGEPAFKHHQVNAPVFAGVLIPTSHSWHPMLI